MAQPRDHLSVECSEPTAAPEKSWESGSRQGLRLFVGGRGVELRAYNHARNTPSLRRCRALLYSHPSIEKENAND
jgi:hypothetical protein